MLLVAIYCGCACRILHTGDAIVLDINLESVISTASVPSGLTHLITETYYNGSGLQAIANLGIHCLLPEYIGDFLIKVWLWIVKSLT